MNIHLGIIDKTMLATEISSKANQEEIDLWQKSQKMYSEN